MTEAWIIDTARTPRSAGKIGKGKLAHLHPHTLLATALAALAERNQLNTADLDDVIAGCGSQRGIQGFCIGRMAALAAGYSQEATGFSVERFCGSGLTSVNLAAMGIMSGMQHLAIGSGVEMMSLRTTFQGVPDLIDSNNLELREKYPQPNQGICADVIASLEGFSREDADKLALESQKRAAHAIANGYFDKSLVPVLNEDGSVALAQEDYPRAGTTLEGLAELNAAFTDFYDYELGPEGNKITCRKMIETAYPDLKVDHIHHAGNSSGVVDGAGAVLLASPEYAKAHGLKPRAKIRAIANGACDPILMLNAPVAAAQKAAKIAGMNISDIDLFEVNEAFAVVPLKFMRDLNIDSSIVNVNGGAMALGHPIGATGSIIIGTLLDEMERRDLNTGMATMCTGGGMAPALIIERM